MKLYIIILALLTITSMRCARSSPSPHAETIPTPQVGFVCFVIYDENNKAIGGNCAKE